MLSLFKINSIFKAPFMKPKTIFAIFIIITNIFFAPFTFANEKSLNLTDQEDAKASLKLGWMYFNGEGVVQDYEKAFIWFEKASEKGNTKGTWEISKMYYNGIGITKDSKKAKILVEKAYKDFMEAGRLGDGHASRKVAEGYFFGLLGRNYEKAVIWYEKAGEQGDTRALLFLDHMYIGALGVTQDSKKRI